jgi:hypothetical protein
MPMTRSLPGQTRDAVNPNLLSFRLANAVKQEESLSLRNHKRPLLDNNLCKFLVNPLHSFQNHGILVHLFRKGRPLLRITEHLALRQCRPLDGLGCMWASFRNVSY